MPFQPVVERLEIGFRFASGHEACLLSLKVEKQVIPELSKLGMGLEQTLEQSETGLEVLLTFDRGKLSECR